MPAERTGIRFQNELDPETALDVEHLLIGSGVALGDVDGDDFVDIFLARLEGPNALYRNRGGWRFEEVTDEAGVAMPDRYSSGAVFADVNGNGHLDLIVSSLGGANALFRNDGEGRFTEVEGWAGAEPEYGGTTLALADVDGSGSLDLYVANYKVRSAKDLLLPYENPDLRLTVPQGDSFVVVPEYRDQIRMAMQDGEPIAQERAHPDRLYLNDGAGTFEPVSWRGGRFLDVEGRPVEREMDYFALAARFYDVTGNGAPDLYVANDFDDRDRFWLNDGTGTFHQVPSLALRSTSHASMSVDFADLERNGRVDFFVADMLSPDPEMRLIQRPPHSVEPRPLGGIEHRAQFQRNSLQRQREDGTFAQIAELAGVDASGWTWGSLFLDVELDGYEDLLVVNGHRRDIQNADAHERLAQLQGRISWREAKTTFPKLDTRNLAFRNRGDLTFEKVGQSWGFGTEPDVSHGIATGDLSGNGALDVVVNRLGAPPLILRNDAPAPRVKVTLRGEGANTRGVGARVRLLDGAVPFQEREMTAGGLYLSHSDYALSFAAGEAREMTLEVRWRSGKKSVVSGVRPNRRYEIRESGAGESWEPEPFRLPGSPREEARDETLFEDATDLLDHIHPERVFEEFRRQPLIPFEVGRLGPGVAWSDLNGSGRPDLVVAPGAGGRVSWLRNDGDRFTTVYLEEAAGELDHTTPLAVPLAGRRGLLIGQSNWGVRRRDELAESPSVLGWDLGMGAEAGPVPVVDGDLNSTGPMAVADLTGNGELDLFVGGRAIPGIYPLGSSSRLFVRNGEELTLHPASEDLFQGVGLVSGAVFSDVSGNGFPDLLLAVEWGSPRLFLNDGSGDLAEATASWGLEKLVGRWNGVATGDLTGNGRMDMVLTNWGRNVRERPHPERPLLLYQGDLYGTRRWDMILAQRGREGDRIRPLERLERVREALPMVRRRIPSFEAYSQATLREILGEDPSGVHLARAETYDHLVLINHGDRFEARPLPLEAQFAPAFAALIFDADGDGHEDLFLAQNFFAVQPWSPRLDAGRGLLLEGDGTGGLEPVPGSRSGILVHGAQRGAALADFDGDGRVDLAVSQNGAPTRLFRNVGAEAGLRVRLLGPPGNPDGIGAWIRLVYDEGEGPVREIQGGSGYWSMNDPVQILGRGGEPTGVRVRWPDGETEIHPVPPGAREVRIAWTGEDGSRP